MFTDTSMHMRLQWFELIVMVGVQLGIFDLKT